MILDMQPEYKEEVFMKKILCGILSMLMLIGSLSFMPSVSAEEFMPEAYMKPDMLYAHAVSDNSETEAWCCWQNADIYRDYDDDDLRDIGKTREEGISKEKYFFLPSSVSGDTVSILNTYSDQVTVGDTVIPANSVAEIRFNTNNTVKVTVGGKDCELKFMISSAEAAVYVNNPDADGNGTDLYSYLEVDKERSASATGAIVERNGSVDNTPIKKIKGRGNTTWQKEKKPFNITYDSAVTIDNMPKTKKFSMLANYQDSSLIRNRFLYDLSDRVGLPYASDSRFVDFYINGEYRGSYQMAQKVDVGKNSLVPEVTDTGYLNVDGTVKDNFAFLVEVDAGADDLDYWTKSSVAGCKLTVKGPELEKGDANYNAVLSFVKTKFDNMYTAVRTNSSNMSELVDIDSLTKILLINELSKNWDVGVSSLYFVYKQDGEGNWKFFGSPVWDYDNSLGNATGIKGDLNRMGVSDYEEPTGWWVKFKPGASNQKSGKYTILGWAARNSTIMKYAAQIWFDEFIPAINEFNSKNISTGELYSSDVYYSLVSSSADMNYTMGWLLTTGSWICDHSALRNGTFDVATGKYAEDSKDTRYDINTFEGQYAYTVDWLNSRVAWLSAQFAADYEGTLTTDLILGDSDMNGTVNVKDATLIQKSVAGLVTLSQNAEKSADANRDGAVNVKDATAIQKYVAGMELPYAIGEKIG